VKNRSEFVGRPLLGQLGVALVILTVLAVGKSMFIPLALAVLAATLLAPIVSRWEGVIGRAAASFAAVALMVTLVVSCLSFAGLQIAAIAQELPDYSANISRKLGELRIRENPKLAEFEAAVREFARQLEEVPLAAPLVRVIPQADSIANRLTPIGAVIEELVTALLIVTLVFFLLLHAEVVNDKIRRLFGRAHVATTSGALRSASQRIGRYLLLQTISNAVTGVLVGGALLLLGVPHAAFFGLLTGILRFVPYIGTAFAAILPTLLAFAVSPDWLLPILTLAMILAIDSAFGMIIEPLWFGSRIGVSPIVLPLSAMVWTWIWGPIGLILSTPIAVSLQVIGETVPSLGFLDVIFGMGSRLDPALQFLGRLLARNKVAAHEMALRLEAELGLEALYEEVLAPALIEIESARAEGRIAPDVAREAREATCAIIASPAPFTHHPHGVRVLVASPGEAEDPFALMTVQVLRSRGHEVFTLPHDLDAQATLDEVFRVHPRVLVMAFSRRGQVEASTDILSRIRRDWPRLGVIVTCSGPVESTSHLRDLGCRVARSLVAVRDLVPRMAARAAHADISPFTPKSSRSEAT